MDEAKLIELMLSWEKGYIAPSAQIVFRDARLLIADKNEQIKQLEEELNVLRSNTGNNGGDDFGGTVASGDEPEPTPAPRKLRGKKTT